MTLAPCLAKTDLTADEQRFLNDLPDGGNVIEPVAECWIWAGHPGPHMTLGQACGNEDGFEWWIRWSDDDRSVERVAMCESSDIEPGRFCMLPASHWGEHDLGGG